jgi:putative acetyltransferase
MQIVLRRAEPDDYEAVWRTLLDEAAYSGTLQAPFPSREMWRKRVAELPESDFMLVALVDGQVVGHAALHSTGKSPRRAHAMHLGMTVDAAWQGKGVGTALLRALMELADGWLNVFRIELTVFADNERAQALYRKFGFVLEGTHRAYALRAGSYVDACSMARIKPKTAPV